MAHNQAPKMKRFIAHCYLSGGTASHLLLPNINKKYLSLDSENGFNSVCGNVSDQKQFCPEPAN